MDEKKSMELTKEQLDEVAGGNWDEENGFSYFEGTVVDMGGRTAFVKIDFSHILKRRRISWFYYYIIIFSFYFIIYSYFFITNHFFDIIDYFLFCLG